MRTVLHSEGQWFGWGLGSRLVSSALTRVEGLRVLDRLRLVGGADEKNLEAAHAALVRLLATVETIDLNPGILQRAGEPLPAVLGTLDAIHLATARTVMEWGSDDFVLVTHDQAMAKAARLLLIKVVGDA